MVLRRYCDIYVGSCRLGQLAWLVSDNSALFYVRVCVCVVCLWCNAVFVVKTYIWLISLMQHVFVSAGGSED